MVTKTNPEKDLVSEIEVHNLNDGGDARNGKRDKEQNKTKRRSTLQKSATAAGKGVY